MLSSPRAENLVMDVEKLDELLECSICLERLAEDSKVLPCQHTFCRQCLDHLHLTKSELRCPECRILVTIPLDQLPNNILLARLLEGMKLHGVKMEEKKTAPGTSSKNVGSWSNSKPNTPLQRVTPTPKQPWAKALYKYEGTEPGDLSFNKGDVILLRAAVDENWFQGEISGKIGVFPISYVQVAVPLTENLPKCRALYNFEVTDSTDMNCLKFQKDQMLTVIRRVDDNWAEGMINDRIGIFPISFVEMNDAVRRLIEKDSKPVITQENDLNSERKISNLSPQCSSSVSNTCDLPLNMPTHGHCVRRGQSLDTTSPTPVTAFRRNKSMDASSQSPPQVVKRSQPGDATSSKRLSLDVTSTVSSPPSLAHHRLSAEIPSTVCLLYLSDGGSGSSSSSMTSSGLLSIGTPKSAGHSPLDPPGNCPLSPTTPSGHRLGPPPNEPPPPPPAVYSALYNYLPAKEDELELVKGEFYTVVEKCHDGWYKGASLKTGRVGVFPGNYVQFSSRSPKPVSPCLTPPVTSQANDRSDTHIMFPLPGMCPLTPPRTSPQHQPSQTDKKTSFIKRFKPGGSKLGRQVPKIVTLCQEGGSIRMGHIQALPLTAPSIEKNGAAASKIKAVARDRYRCVVPYPPNSDLELELAMGDVVIVHKKRDDGWYKGTLERTGKTGLFPSSFVEPF